MRTRPTMEGGASAQRAKIGVSGDSFGSLNGFDRDAALRSSLAAPSAEVIGKLVSILIPADRQDEEPHILARIRRDERVGRYDPIRQRKVGGMVEISLTLSPTGGVLALNAATRVIKRFVESSAR